MNDQETNDQSGDTVKNPVTPSTSDGSEQQKQSGGFWEIIRFTIIALAIVIPIRMFIAQPFVVSGESMYPTFHDGDYLIIDEISYHLGEPERWDVVVFRYPLQPDRFFIKRVIALPGETVSAHDDMIIVEKNDGTEMTLDEPYLGNDYIPRDFDELTLDDEEYFVMGDNRDASSDSRIWGPLPEKMITGRALIRLLPTSDIMVLPGDYKQPIN